MSLDYNIIESLKLLLVSYKYNVMISINIASIILFIIFMLNKNKNINKYIISTINVLLIIIIGYYYIKDIFSFKYSNPINNIYFYFLNTILFLVIIGIRSIRNKVKILDYLVYNLSLINILFSLFMTYYLSNITLIVIGNIFPMIKFGNIIYILYYIYILIRFLYRFLTKKA